MRMQVFVKALVPWHGLVVVPAAALAANGWLDVREVHAGDAGADQLQEADSALAENAKQRHRGAGNGQAKPESFGTLAFLGEAVRAMAQAIDQGPYGERNDDNAQGDHHVVLDYLGHAQHVHAFTLPFWRN